MKQKINYKLVKLSERTPEASFQYFTDKGYLKYDRFTRSFYGNDGFVVPVDSWFEEIVNFENSCKVLIQYLNENHHPHTTVIVNSTSAEMLEGIQIISNVTEFLIG